MDTTVAPLEIGRLTGREPFVVLRGMPIGEVSATPTERLHPAKPAGRSEATLLDVAGLLGEPVGYAQELGGALVQDLYPTAGSVGRQVSTGSGVELAFHTETSFHPHRPHHLLLLCLRGDPAASTTLCTLDAITERLSRRALEVLAQPRFRTGVDESFGGGPGCTWTTEPMPVIADGALVYDGELTVGIDDEADRALAEVRDAIVSAQTAVVLEAGDLLVVDNHRAVHGRSSFRARFDGTDRWLQRSFVVDSLGPSASERDGRVITTSFAAPAS